MADTEIPVTLAHDDEKIAESWREIQEKYAIDDVEKIDASDGQSDLQDNKPPSKERGSDGRFLKKDAVTDDANASGAVDDNVDGRDQQKVEGQSDSDAADRSIAAPPSSWKPTAKAAWTSIPSDIRTEILRRESDFLKGQSELIHEAQFAKDMRAKLEPYRAMVEAEGGTLPQAAANLFRTAAILRTGTPEVKQQALLNIAREFGISLPGGGDAEAQSTPTGNGQFRDPRFDAFLANMQQQERNRLQAEEAEILSVIDTFSGEVDAQGNPLRPYFSNLETEIAALIPSFKKPGVPYEQVLQSAYDAAVWANPETRRLAQQDEVEKLEAKRREESLRRTAEAKKAASINMPRRGIESAQPAKGEMEDTIRRAGRELGIF